MPARLTTIDLLASICAIGALLWSAIAVLKLAPAHEEMFAQFGLIMPLFARIVLSRPVLIAFGTLPLAVVSTRALFGRDAQTRTWFSVTAIAIALAGPALFFIAEHLLELQGIALRFDF